MMIVAVMERAPFRLSSCFIDVNPGSCGCKLGSDLLQPLSILHTLHKCCKFFSQCILSVTVLGGKYLRLSIYNLMACCHLHSLW